MKILLVNKFHYIRGGSETYYFSLAEALKHRGHEVVFFSMKDDRNFSCEQELYFVSNRELKGGVKSKLNLLVHMMYSKEAYENISRLLQDEKPDLVILSLVHRHLTLSIIDAIKAYNPNLPIFWTMHDLIAVCPCYTMRNGKDEVCEQCLQGSFAPCVKNRCMKGSFLMSLLSKWEAELIRKKKWYHQIDLFICPSEFYRRKLTEGKFTMSPIVTIRNPLPLSTVYEVSTSNDGYVLYFGRLSYEKGIKTLIDAAVKINCRLVIVGTGSEEAPLKAYAEKMPNVEFKGFQSGNALTDFIKSSCCVVLPSEWYENGPYSAMEAMALGKPLVVSNYGGLPELVIDGHNGYIHEPNADSLATCLKKMLQLSDAEYKQMAQNSCQMAKVMFNPDNYIAELENWFYRINH